MKITLYCIRGIVQVSVTIIVILRIMSDDTIILLAQYMFPSASSQEHHTRTCTHRTPLHCHDSRKNECSTRRKLAPVPSPPTPPPFLTFIHHHYFLLQPPSSPHFPHSHRPTKFKLIKSQYRWWKKWALKYFIPMRIIITATAVVTIY